MALGKRVKSRREQLKMSQDELAQAIGVTGAAISALETRDSRSSRQLSKLAKALSTSEQWLETGVEVAENTIQEDRADYTALSPDEIRLLSAFKKASGKQRELTISLLESIGLTAYTAPDFEAAVEMEDVTEKTRKKKTTELIRRTQ